MAQGRRKVIRKSDAGTAPDCAVGLPVRKPLPWPLQAALEPLRGSSLGCVEADVPEGFAFRNVAADKAVRALHSGQPRRGMQHGRENVLVHVRGVHQALHRSGSDMRSTGISLGKSTDLHS